MDDFVLYCIQRLGSYKLQNNKCTNTDKNCIVPIMILKIIFVEILDHAYYFYKIGCRKVFWANFIS